MAFEAIIEYGMSADELFALHYPDMRGKREVRIASGVINQFYGSNSHHHCPRMSIEAVAEKLETLITDAVLVEHSIQFCDSKCIRAIFDLAGKPVPQYRCISTYDLFKRFLLKHFWSYALPAMFPLFVPGSDLIFRHHVAAVDAQKLCSVMDVVFGSAFCFEDTPARLKAWMASHSETGTDDMTKVMIPPRAQRSIRSFFQ